MTIKKVIDDVGISKASLHRFFSKGGYESFKDLITILDEEVKQKKCLISVSYTHLDVYKRQVVEWKLFMMMKVLNNI